MTCRFRGAWFGPDYDEGISAGTETFFDPESVSRVANAHYYSWLFPATSSEGGSSYHSNNPAYAVQNYDPNSGHCDYYMAVTELEEAEEDGERIWVPKRTHSAMCTIFPPVEEMSFTVLMDHHILRGTAERPSRYDTYWEGVQFIVPFSGSRWRFTANRDIPNSWWIQLLELTG